MRGGSGWVVSTPTGERLDGNIVIGKKKCCWSRSAPIVYTRHPISCSNAKLPEVFHGSQWASLHYSLVHHVVRHPVAQSVMAAMEHTLLPDEAMLQTTAVNSPLRKTLIGQHMRFIEWPQLHGDANKYWASLGPQFHGGPMVLNATLAVHKAFLTSAMFARKFDPTVYNDVLPLWDSWMAAKLETQQPAPRQPSIGNSQIGRDPQLQGDQPSPTAHENDALVDALVDNGGSHPPSAVPLDLSSSRSQIASTDVVGARDDHEHPHSHELHDHEGDGHGRAHEEAPTFVAGLVLFWVGGIIVAGLIFACITAFSDLDCFPAVLRVRWRPKTEGLKDF